ncbi:MAG: carboxypeptidase-like regulatory domain-containing protein, partial [Terriglobia bacterium]
MKFRRSKLAWPLAGVLLLGAFSPALPAAEVVGRVVNGTTGQPVPGQFVNLLALRGQMVPVRETYTDDEGRYRFVVAANPSERFLVQVPFQGVNYNQPAMF